ncbi:hypothetical protein ACFXTO_030209 [Malus domestica]
MVSWTTMMVLRILFLSLKDGSLSVGGTSFTWTILSQMFSRPEEFCLIGSVLLNLAVQPLSSSSSSASSKTERLKSLIEYNPSCSKKDLKEKVLKILELDDLDDEEMRSEHMSS